MEWIKSDSLIIDKEKKLTMNQFEKKLNELDRIGFDNTPPILIDSENKIIDGVKRYLVLRKMGYEFVPTQRINENYEVYINNNFFENNLKIAA
jgi:hypothetical protein